MTRPPSKITVSTALWATVLICTHTVAMAAPTQNIYLDKSSITASSGTPIVFNLQYTTSDNNSTMTGLGIYLYWNSNKLAFTAKTHRFTGGSVASGADGSCMPDNDNLDGDTTTNCYTDDSWVDFAGNWPNVALPITLYTANFISKLNPGTNSKINFTASRLLLAMNLSPPL